MTIRAAARPLLGAAASVLILLACPAFADSLKIGLAVDPDTLDPVTSRSMAGRNVMSAFCDKLFDVGPKLEILPQLATAWSWSEDGRTLTITLRSGVVFQDGENFDAAAVKFNLDRALTLPASSRRSEFPAIEAIETPDPLTVRIALKAPFAPLVGVLTDRAGMMLSPKAAAAPGADMANHPVCAGPFRLVEHLPQDRIVLERFERYWDKDHVKLDRITYLPLPDSTVRLANLESGDLDLIEQVPPTDLAELEGNAALTAATAPSLAYFSIVINLANGPAADTPLGQDARVRQAFALAIDRGALNEVVFAGKYIPDNQFMPLDSPFHDPGLPLPGRDLAKAKALLQAAGAPHPAVTLLVGTSPVQQQLAQVIQAMTEEAGFAVKLQAIEFASSQAAAKQGDFQAILTGWSGRFDPDGNIYSFLHTGGAFNDGHYRNETVDRLLDEARVIEDMTARRALYNQVQEIQAQDLPLIYLYHNEWIWGLSRKLRGFQPMPDGIIRLTDLDKPEAS